MQRESEVEARIAQELAAWKRIGRLTPEAGADPMAAAIFVLGLAAVLVACAAAQ